MVLLEPSKKEELDMKRIGSLLTAGALALSLVTLPAGAADFGVLQTVAEELGRERPDGRRGPEHPVRPVAGWGDHPHRPRGKLFPHGEPRPHR